MPSATEPPGSYYDALVVGAGFSGIYQLKLLRDQGLRVLVIDAAGGVGGTWYWNQYPGAMSDTESYIYRYSWDKEDLQTYEWKEHYVKQPEVLAYLNHITDRYDLRPDMRFNTTLVSASWNFERGLWDVETSAGPLQFRFLITGLGLLSKQNFPNIAGIDQFAGEKYHTGAWPDNHDFREKRVGVIGSGSTGVQVITALAKEVKHLVSFQRSPQYSVPSGDGPVSKNYRDSVNKRYDEIWDQVRNSAVAFGFEESTRPTMSVSAEERQQIFQELWDQGNGFRFMFGGFGDITTSEEANLEACNFIKSKIAETVKDPEKRRKLLPTEFYARRPLCDAGYYQRFNQDNVDIVSLKETPITEIVPEGIKTADGRVHELDVIVFATGFDAVDGNYLRLNIRGRDGVTLKDHWSEGPTSYLGICVSGFPNMFMITGPNGPFTNIPPTVEEQVRFVSSAISTINDTTNGVQCLEASPEAEREWMDHCNEICKDTIFHKSASWIFGANVPGKKYGTRFYFGGLKAYREFLQQRVGEDLGGFIISKLSEKRSQEPPKMQQGEVNGNGVRLVQKTRIDQ